jgi:hypothetical protein
MSLHPDLVPALASVHAKCERAELLGVDEYRDQDDAQDESGNCQQQSWPHPPMGVFGHSVVRAR